jgi:RNA polymerase sigma factor (sigma-70 family)
MLTLAMLTPNDDVTLALESASDATARERLVVRLSGRTQKLCGAMLKNSVDAEDACQVALCEVLQAAPSFRGECRLEAWADRITARVCIRLSRARRLASVRVTTEVSPDAFAGHSTPDQAWESLPQSIRVYLDQLPEVKRTALLLRHVLDYSIEEIAECTEVSVNTVKDRLLSAREQIRKLVRRDVALGEARAHSNGVPS